MGAGGIMTNRVIWGHPEINTKRSCIVNSVISIALSLATRINKMLRCSVQSLIGSPGTLVEPFSTQT